MNPTKITVQLLGPGSVILFSVSKDADLNVNFVISAEEFVRCCRELKERAEPFPDSPLQELQLEGPEI
jgi:hypothetical protein